jgi:hypothetical protein
MAMPETVDGLLRRQRQRQPATFDLHGTRLIGPDAHGSSAVAPLDGGMSRSPAEQSVDHPVQQIIFQTRERRGRGRTVAPFASAL